MKKNNLPNDIAIFPLSHAIFFPRTILPLNIFEDRYIQLVRDCMNEKKMFGMIQPKVKSQIKTDVYQVGCLGKIVSFTETNDKRFIINLSGIIRFRIKKELDSNKLYRKFNVDYSDFVYDLEAKNIGTSRDKINLLKKIKYFFGKINYSIEFKLLLKLNIDQLIHATCMLAPFSVEEKQKLIEVIKIEDKYKLLNEIIDFNLFDLTENKTLQ